MFLKFMRYLSIVFSIFFIVSSNNMQAISDEGKVLTPLYSGAGNNIAEVLTGLAATDFNELSPEVVGAKEAYQENLKKIAKEFKKYYRPKIARNVVVYYNALLDNSISLAKLFSEEPVNLEQVKIVQKELNIETLTFFQQTKNIIYTQKNQTKFFKILEHFKASVEKLSKNTGEVYKNSSTEKNIELNNSNKRVIGISQSIGYAYGNLLHDSKIPVCLSCDSTEIFGDETLIVNGANFSFSDSSFLQTSEHSPLINVFNTNDEDDPNHAYIHPGPSNNKPSISSGTYYVRVQNQYGLSKFNENVRFTYHATSLPPPPTPPRFSIKSIKPDIVDANSYTLVQIHGENLNEIRTLRIEPADACWEYIYPHFDIKSSSLIEFIVPPNTTYKGHYEPSKPCKSLPIGIGIALYNNYQFYRSSKYAIIYTNL